jgi:hypothetical protein
MALLSHDTVHDANCGSTVQAEKLKSMAEKARQHVEAVDDIEGDPRKE